MKCAVKFQPAKGAHSKTEVYSGRTLIDALDQAKKAHPTWEIKKISIKQ